MTAMSPLVVLCACSLFAHAHDEIPKGTLGHPLGTYLTIGGVRADVDNIGVALVLARHLNKRVGALFFLEDKS